MVEDDVAVADLVRAVLTDDGFQVSLLHQLDPDSVRSTVNQLEPDCVLLDSTAGAEYAASWDTAAWAHTRGRSVPVIMFSAHTADTQEAQAGVTGRAVAAHFSAVIAKPFDLDALVETVRRCSSAAVPFERSAAADTARTAELKRRLEDAGAQDIEVSDRREWATCTTTDGATMLLYYWQRDGVYYVVRLGDGGPRLIGRLHDQDAAITLALAPAPAAHPDSASDR